MFDFFSTREIAVILWLTFIFVYALTKDKNGAIKNSILMLVKTALSWLILIPIMLLLLYGLLIICLFSLTDIWNPIFIKDILLWTVFVGIPSCFNSYDTDNENGYLKESIFTNFRVIAIMEFLFNSFTFNFWVEMVTVPIMTIISTLDLLTKGKENYTDVNKFINILQIFAGLFFLNLTLDSIESNFYGIDSMEFLIKMLIPFLLSFFYVPFIYLFAVWAKYSVLFNIVRFKENDYMDKRWKFRLPLIKACGLSYAKICRCIQEYRNTILISNQRKDFISFVNNFKAEHK